MFGRILVAIAVGFLGFVAALIIGGLFHLGAIVAYASGIGLAVGIIWFFGYGRWYGPRGPVV